MKCLTGAIGNNRIRPYAGPAGTAYGLAVKQGASDGAVILPTGAGQKCLGIVFESDLTNSGILAIARSGETVAIAGAAIAADDYLIANAAGQLVTSTTAADFVLARAITSAAALGDEVLVEICQFIR